MNEKYVKLVSTGTYLPNKPIPFEKINDTLGILDKAPKKIQKWMLKTQDILSQMLETEYCYYAFDPETREYTDDNVSLSAKAAKTAMEKSDTRPEEMDVIIYAGQYSSQIPPISTMVQEAVGMNMCGEFHIHSNCTSVYKALAMAHDFLRYGRYKKALVVSSMITSAHMLPEFYNQEKVRKEDIFLRWFLCDGAGAFILEAEDEPGEGFYMEDTYTLSSGRDKISVMGNNYPAYWPSPIKEYENCEHHMKQLFQDELMKHFFDENKKTCFTNGLDRMLAHCNISLERLKYFVINMPTKSVRDIIADECLELGITREVTYSGIGKEGYAGPPTALISIDKLLESGVQFEDRDLLFSFVIEASKFMEAGFTLRYNKKSLPE